MKKSHCTLWLVSIAHMTAMMAFVILCWDTYDKLNDCNATAGSPLRVISDLNDRDTLLRSFGSIIATVAFSGLSIITWVCILCNNTKIVWIAVFLCIVSVAISVFWVSVETKMLICDEDDCTCPELYSSQYGFALVCCLGSVLVFIVSILVQVCVHNPYGPLTNELMYEG